MPPYLAPGETEQLKKTNKSRRRSLRWVKSEKNIS
jgi:hypothetical protein